MNIREDILSLESHPGWKYILEKIKVEFERNVAGVKVNARTGETVRTAVHASWCDPLDWVSQLPLQIRRSAEESTELARKEYNA